jgi:hypothetical protein
MFTKNPPKMKLWQYIGLGLAGIFAVLQLFQIDKTNPESDPSKDMLVVTNAPDNVAVILKDACYDCHSNNTKYPWYTSLQPFAWSIQNHIKNGRKHINFSEFGDYSREDRSEVFEECVEVLQEGEMPLASYKLMHQEAILSDEQTQTLMQWFSGNGEEFEN